MATDRKKAGKSFYWILFALYIIFLLYVLFFSDLFGRTVQTEEYRYNLKLFREIKNFYRALRNGNGFYLFWLNVLGNVAVFIPFGCLTPVLMKNRHKLILTIELGFLFSVSVETLQLFTRVGVFDVDDIFLNTVGTIIGCLIWLINSKLKARRNE